MDTETGETSVTNEVPNGSESPPPIRVEDNRKTKMMEINAFPREILMSVFRWLPPKDIKMAVLVSKQWMSVAGDPKLWKWTKVTVQNRDHINMLCIKRIKKIEVIAIGTTENWKAEDWETFFRAVIMLPNLKEIDGLGHITITPSNRSAPEYPDKKTVHNMWSVKKGLLAMALTKLEVMNLNGSSMHKGQIAELFVTMSSGNSQLKKFNLANQDLSSLEPGTFARAVAGLEEVKLTDTGITNCHVQALIEIISQTCQLKNLDISSREYQSNALSLTVEPDLLAMALTKLEVVNLNGGSYIQKGQIAELFAAMSRNSQLKELNVSNQDLSSMEPEMFAGAMAGLEKVEIRRINTLTNQHVQALFKKISGPCQLLKNLQICNCTNILNSVEPELFAMVVSKLEVAIFSEMGLTNNQVMALFRVISQSSKIKELTLNHEELSCVEPNHLAMALTKIENVCICSTYITSDQQVELFNQMDRNSRIKFLNLYYLELDDVEPLLFARVLARLEIIDMSDTITTNEQKAEFFKEVCQSTTLRKLDLSQVNLSAVDSDILGKAVSKLVEVDLCDTKMSIEQLTSIITQAQGETKLKKLSLLDRDIINSDAGEVVWNAVELMGDIIWIDNHKLKDLDINYLMYHYKIVNVKILKFSFILFSYLPSRCTTKKMQNKF